MKAVGVPDKMRRLVMDCFRVSKITILVNNKSSGFIQLTRGLRQGCLLSPYCFILAMKFLSKAFRRAALKGEVKIIKVIPTPPCLTHAMYADYLIIFGQA
jgi:Reverse transcriptase (RNA-dependent DNA polymerase)